MFLACSAQDLGGELSNSVDAALLLQMLPVCFLLLEEDDLVSTNQIVLFVPAIYRHLLPLCHGQNLL